MVISNIKLHQKGVSNVLKHVPVGTHVELIPGKNYDYINTDTDFLIKSRASNIEYEIRVLITKAEIKNEKITWMLMEHNLKSVHPRFIYVFFHTDKTTTPATDRLFIIPSKVISNYIESNFNTKENGRKKFYNFTIDLSNKDTSTLHTTDYQDRWDLLK